MAKGSAGSLPSKRAKKAKAMNHAKIVDVLSLDNATPVLKPSTDEFLDMSAYIKCATDLGRITGVIKVIIPSRHSLAPSAPLRPAHSGCPGRKARLGGANGSVF